MSSESLEPEVSEDMQYDGVSRPSISWFHRYKVYQFRGQVFRFPKTLQYISRHVPQLEALTGRAAVEIIIRTMRSADFEL